MKTRAQFVLGAALAAAVLTQSGHSADLYWDSNGDAVGIGGSGNWNGSALWRNGSDAGPLIAWSANQGAILAGTGGTLMINTTSVSATTATVVGAAYTIQSTAAARTLSVSGGLALDAAQLTLAMPTGSSTWSLGSISMTQDSVLTLAGGAGANGANRFNLTTNVISDGGTITLAGTGAGPTGFVSTTPGAVLNSNIVNNSSTSATMLGATGTLSYGGVISGTAHLQISAGVNSGMGTVTLLSSNTYGGDTYLNNAAGGSLTLGVANALPTGTNVYFGQSAGGGTAAAGGTLNLNGFSQTIAGLNGTGSGVVNAASAAVLTLHTLGTPSYDGTISGNITLVKSGPGTQTLTGSNNYSGGTSVIGGTLIVNNTTGSGTGSGTLEILNPGSTLSGDGMIGAAVIIGDGAIHAPGNSPGIQTFNDTLEYSPGSIFSWDISTAGGVRGAPDGYDGVNVDEANLSGSDAIFRIVLQGSGENFSTPFWSIAHDWTDIFKSADGSTPLTSWTSIFSGGFSFANADGDLSAPTDGSFSFNGGTLSWRPSASAVPEPGNALVAVVLVAGLLRRQRTRTRAR